VSEGEASEGPRLTEAGERLWRNVNPDWIEDDGSLTSQAFRPMPKDEGKLSTARSGKVDAADHFHEFTNRLDLDSVGVWAVTVGEGDALGVPSIYDAEGAAAPDPCPAGHTFMDFRQLTSGKARKVGAKLRDHAEARHRQHP